MINWLIGFFSDYSSVFKKPVYKTDPVYMPNVPSFAQNSPTPAVNPDALGTDWSNPVVAHHNCRALADLEGLTYDQKESMVATIYGESEFNINAVRQNWAINAQGERYVASTDNGICQWNDWYHGKEITPDQALHDPEKAVRLMCQYWKMGRMKQWVAYLNGRYKLFLGKV